MSENGDDGKPVEVPSSANNSQGPGNAAKPDYLSAGIDNAKLVYILYFVTLIPTLLGFFGVSSAGILGLAGIVGFVFAFLNKSAEDPVARSHYEFQFNTGWKGFLIALGAIILFLTGILFFVGAIVYLGLFIWFIIRCFKGWQLLAEGKAHPNPDTWSID